VYRDFLEAFGIDLQGVAFERVLWLFALSLAGWGLYGGIQQLRAGDTANGALRTVVSVAAVLFFGYSAWQAWFSPTYARFFADEIVIHTYALAIVTGFLLATWVAAREGRRVGIDPTVILDVSFWALIFGMIGARLLFIVVNHETYVAACTDPGQLEHIDPALASRVGPEGDCLLVFRFWEGGLVFYGAFIGAALCVLYYARKHQIRGLVLLDTMVPSLALGQAFGRLGCLGGGCCWGQVCTNDWGIRYHRGEMPWLDAVDRMSRGESVRSEFLDHDAGMTAFVHPTPLYETFGELAIFLALLLWRPYKRCHGEILALWMTLYGFFRTLTEMTRGDRVRGYAVEIAFEPLNRLLALPADHATFLTTSQIIGLALGFGGLSLFYWLRRQAAPVSTPANG